MRPLHLPTPRTPARTAGVLLVLAAALASLAAAGSTQFAGTTSEPPSSEQVSGPVSGRALRRPRMRS